MYSKSVQGDLILDLYLYTCILDLNSIIDNNLICDSNNWVFYIPFWTFTTWRKHWLSSFIQHFHRQSTIEINKVNGKGTSYNTMYSQTGRLSVWCIKYPSPNQHACLYLWAFHKTEGNLNIQQTMVPCCGSGGLMCLYDPYHQASHHLAIAIKSQCRTVIFGHAENFKIAKGFNPCQSVQAWHRLYLWQMH